MNGSILIPESFKLSGKKIIVVIDDDYCKEDKFTKRELLNYSSLRNLLKDFGFFLPDSKSATSFNDFKMVFTTFFGLGIMQRYEIIITLKSDNDQYHTFSIL